MSSIIKFLLPSEYAMRRYARRKVIGCIGGLIGLPLICLFLISLPTLANALNSAGQDKTPWLLGGAAVSCACVMTAIMAVGIVLILRRRGGGPAA